MKLASWNVNGIRSAWDKGLSAFLSTKNFDVVCLQEIKAAEDQLRDDQKSFGAFRSFVFSAKKAGYSSVLTYTKKDPLNVIRGFGVSKFDEEGRVLTLEFDRYFVVNSYFPNSQRDHARLGYKIEFCRAMQKFLSELEAHKPVLVCGDFNIAHKEIDLKNPKANMKNAGFLPEERAWLDEFVEKDKYLDTFRLFNSDGGNYSWWSYRPGVREKNIGWRLDYFFASPGLGGAVKAAKIYPEVMGSDHCPVGVEVAESQI